MRSMFMNAFGLVPGLAICLGVAGYVPESRAALDSAEDIIQCMTGNIPQHNFSLQVGLETVVNGEVEDRFVLDVTGRILAQGGLALASRVALPRDLSGTQYLLRREDDKTDLFVRLPHLARARKVSGDLAGRNLWETSFSFTELQEVFGLLPRSVLVREPDMTLDGRRMYVLEMRPVSTAAAGYPRVRGLVDAATCLPARLELFDENDILIKRLRADLGRRSRENGRLVVHEWTIEDLRTPERVTRLYLGDVRYDARSFSDARFDAAGGVSLRKH